MDVCNGLLGGFVAITSGCSVVETWAAIICGVVCQRKICDPSLQFRCHRSGKTLCATMWPLFYALNKLKMLRISIGEEVLGLDISRHGGYPYAHGHAHAHQENNDPRSHADYMHIQDDQSNFDFMILLVLGIAPIVFVWG
ncbi:hypothetical protein AHAS_Ahas01G0038600 [Arachis hypogaea]